MGRENERIKTQRQIERYRDRQTVRQRQVKSGWGQRNTEM